MTYASSALLNHHAREHEADLLVHLMRLSPATVLLAEPGSEKSAFLKTCFMPLIDAAPHSEHRQLRVFFDEWGEQPLEGLLAAIRRAIPVADAQSEASKSLVTIFAKWQQALQATFLIVFDRFEEYLAMREEPGGIEFEDELVRVMTTPELRAHFLIAVDEHAAPLLEALRTRIPCLGDALVRLPRAPARAVSPKPNEDRALVRTRTFVGSPRRADRSLLQPLDETVSFKMLKPLVLVGSVASTYTLKNEAARIEPTWEHPDRREPVLGKMPAEEDARIASPAPLEQPKAPASVPLAAWAVLGLLVVCALGLLVSTLWQPKPQPVEQAEVTNVPLSIDAAEDPGVSADVEAKADTSAAPVETVPASPADDQLALPAIKDELPRKSAGSRTTQSGEIIASVYINVHSEAERAWAARLVRPLATQGIRVAGIRVVKGGPASADLQYFRPEELAEAARVAHALREIGLPAPRITRVTGLEARSIPQQFELWLPAGVDKRVR